MALVTADLGTLPTEPYVLTGDHVITSGPRPAISGGCRMRNWCAWRWPRCCWALVGG